MRLGPTRHPSCFRFIFGLSSKSGTRVLRTLHPGFYMVASAAEIGRLRNELEARFGRAILPAAPPETERSAGFRTGIAAIDALLPNGVARGTLSLWTGEATAGRTAALRALALHSCGEGATVAVVDAGLTLDATFACTAAGPVPGLWVVRPPDAARTAEGPWAAETLLRAGVFDLVILDGCTLDAAQAHRLRALARERDAAVVVSMAGKRKEERGKRNSEHAFTSVHDASAPLKPCRSTFQYVSMHRKRGKPAPAEETNIHPADFVSGGVESSFLFPLSSFLDFRADVRLEFRCAEGIQASGLMPGGRFRRRARVRLAKTTTSAPAGGEREVEVVHDPTDCLRSHIPAPDRSPGGR
jgi:hypothetical protein